MGGVASKEESYRRMRSFPSSSSSTSSSSWNGQQAGTYAPHHHQPYAPPQFDYYAAAPPPQGQGQGQGQGYGGGGHATNALRLDRKYSKIADNCNSLDEVTSALASAGLESSNLILGIDFTRSNEWTGARSFDRKSLHHTGGTLNPYEQAISIIGKTLSAFDEDNLIPCFGFGDASTRDQDVFSFYPDERFCNGFEEVLSRYREIVPHLRLAGPTSFAPIIEMATTIVEQSGSQYHVLVIIADGQVESPQEQKTVDVIVEASKFPLSIILVGVGDGPWDMMKEFGDNIPARPFDNFQFVNFTEIMSKNADRSRKEAEFALSALMEIPSQYKATIELNILGNQEGKSPQRFPIPPPVVSSRSHPTSLRPSSPPHIIESTFVSLAQPGSRSTYDNQICPICLTDPKDMTYGCGHQTCSECGKDLEKCPICRSPISTRIKLSPLPHFESTSVKSASPALTSTHADEVCPICLTSPKDMAFGCGHQTCCECGSDLEICPICRTQISTRIKLY